MTKKSEIQKQFDYAVRQVIKQGRPSYKLKKGCLYRMKSGDTTLKCPVGWLIPDAYFIKYPEHIGSTEAICLDPTVYSYTRMKPFARKRHILEALQQAHDDAATERFSTAGFMTNFLCRARAVALDSGLKWNFG